MVEWHSFRHRLEGVDVRKPQSRIEEELGTVSSIHYDVQSVPAASTTCTRLPLRWTASAVFQAMLLVVQAMGGRVWPVHARGTQKVSGAESFAQATAGTVLGDLVQNPIVCQTRNGIRPCAVQF